MTYHVNGDTDSEYADGSSEHYGSDGSVTRFDSDGNEVEGDESSDDSSSDGSDGSSDDSSDDSGDGSDAESDGTTTAGTDTDGEETDTESSVDPFGPQPITPEQFERAWAYAEWQANIRANSDITPVPDDGESSGGDVDGSDTLGVKDLEEDQIVRHIGEIMLDPTAWDAGVIDFGPDHSYGPVPEQTDPRMYEESGKQEAQEATGGPQNANVDEAIDFTPSFESGQAATEQIEAAMTGEGFSLDDDNDLDEDMD